jgi:hypothetical protein
MPLMAAFSHKFGKEIAEFECTAGDSDPLHPKE